MELIIEDKKKIPISYEEILKNMNLKVVNGKLSQDQPTKKNVYFYPEENKVLPNNTNILEKKNIPIQFTPKQQYIRYLINKINSYCFVKLIYPKINSSS